MQEHCLQHTEMIPLHEMTSNTRLGLMMGTNSLQRMHTSLDSETSTVTEQAVAKISSMFPTVTETHIRTLLLKYLKNVFPVVEETILLDTLSSSDNNVHHATQTLMTMGFDKKVMSAPRVCLQKQDSAPVKLTPQSSKSILHSPSHKMKSVEEKQEMKMRLKGKHPDIPERVVSIALDSVDFDETRADQILNMMADDKPVGQIIQFPSCSVDMQERANEILIQESPQSESPESTPIVFCCKDNKSVNVKSESSYHSSYSKLATGPNPLLPKGPNQTLLLVSHRPDYVAWTGSNVELVCGPNPSRLGSTTQAKGSNPALRKGPNQSLAKGSIYNQLQKPSLIESRGK